MLELTNRHVSAYVNHNSGLKVAKASTKEFAISRHLYKTNDVAAAYNVGRVLADRCKETGIYRITWEHKRNRNAEKVVINFDDVMGCVLNSVIRCHIKKFEGVNSNQYFHFCNLITFTPFYRVYSDRSNFSLKHFLRLALY